MPVPKRKTSKRRRDQRQSCKFIRTQTFAQCSNCTEALVGHRVCATCGFYKGRQVLKSKLERAASRKITRDASEARRVQAAGENPDQQQ